MLLQSFPGSGPLFPAPAHVFPRVSIAETWPFPGNSCGDIHGGSPMTTPFDFYFFFLNKNKVLISWPRTEFK